MELVSVVLMTAGDGAGFSCLDESRRWSWFSVVLMRAGDGAGFSCLDESRRWSWFQLS